MAHIWDVTKVQKFILRFVKTHHVDGRFPDSEASDRSERGGAAQPFMPLMRGFVISQHPVRC